MNSHRSFNSIMMNFCDYQQLFGNITKLDKIFKQLGPFIEDVTILLHCNSIENPVYLLKHLSMITKCKIDSHANPLPESTIFDINYPIFEKLKEVELLGNADVIFGEIFTKFMPPNTIETFKGDLTKINYDIIAHHKPKNITFMDNSQRRFFPNFIPDNIQLESFEYTTVSELQPSFINELLKNQKKLKKLHLDMKLSVDMFNIICDLESLEDLTLRSLCYLRVSLHKLKQLKNLKRIHFKIGFGQQNFNQFNELTLDTVEYLHCQMLDSNEYQEMSRLFPNLKEFKCSFKSMDAMREFQFAEFLDPFPQLEKLVLNTMVDDKVEAAGIYPNLKTLIMKNNWINSKFLKILPNLEHLETKFTYNAEVLETLINLQELKRIDLVLDVNENQKIENEHEMFKNLTNHLTSMWIRFGGLGLKSLIATLRENLKDFKQMTIFETAIHKRRN